MATAFGSGPTDTIAAGEWSTPVIEAQNGSDGNSVQIEWSVDGSTSWHSIFTSGDKCFHERIGTGAWSAAIKAVGEDGINGLNGTNGTNGTVLGSFNGTGNTAISTAYVVTASGLVTVPDGATHLIVFSARFPNGSGAIRTGAIGLWRDGTLIASGWSTGSIPVGGSVLFSLNFADTPGAGSHTYEVRHNSDAAAAIPSTQAILTIN